GHEPDVLAEAQHAETDLEQPGEHHRGEYEVRAARKTCGDAREHDDHRPGRPGDLRGRAAEKCGEETDEDRSVEPGDRPHAGGDAERERERQRDDPGGDAAEEVASEIGYVYSRHRRSSGFNRP